MSNNPFLSGLVQHHIDSLDNVYSIDFSNHLLSGETLASISETTEEPSGGITVSEQAVNVGAYTDNDGNTVAIGHAVRAKIEGGEENTIYQVEYKVLTSTGRTLVGILQVEAFGDD